jgi:hypothetical protein
MLPDLGGFAAARRGGTRTDIAPPPPFVPKDPEVWWRMQRIQAAPPGLREVYSFLTGAGNFAVVTPGIDVLARWLRREDPTKGLEEFRKESQAAFYASPLAHFAGQGFGLAGLGGLAARGLMAKGAELGAKGTAEQLLAGLRTFARPAAAGGAAGAVAGAAVGAATGRDPATEAVRFGVLGATAGLGATRHQLAAGGLLGGVVGGTTAVRHGVEKGIEAGAAVFPLPAVLPERLARGFFAGLTAERRPDVKLQAEQTGRQVPVEWVKLRHGMSPEEAAKYASELRWNPDEQREFFKMLVEEALAKQRAGDVGALWRLRGFMQWLDRTSRQRFEEVLKEYGLIEIKHRTHEYSLDEEAAPALARIFKRDFQRAPEHRLTDEAAALLNQLLKMDEKTVSIFTPKLEPTVPVFRRRVKTARRGRETWLLPQEGAPTVEIFRLRDRDEQTTAPVPMYKLEPLAAERQDRTHDVVPVQRTTQRETTTDRTTPVQTTVTTPPPRTPPYVPPWMLRLPASAALPLLEQMGLRLPPPPNPNMPLGA